MNDTEQQFPNFAGKTVVFYASGWKELGVLKSPRFEQQVGRWFVVGTAATRESSWARDRDAAVAWDKVCSYILFEETEYDTCQQDWDKRRREKKKRRRR